MSIIIHNIGGDPLGISEYEVCINEKRIATFKHNRLDGLTVCLEKASRACEAQKWVDFEREFAARVPAILQAFPNEPKKR